MYKTLFEKLIDYLSENCGYICDDLFRDWLHENRILLISYDRYDELERIARIHSHSTGRD